MRTHRWGSADKFYLETKLKCLIDYYYLNNVPFFIYFCSFLLSLTLTLSYFFLQRSDGRGLPQATRINDGSRAVVLTVVAMASVCLVMFVALTIFLLRQHAHPLDPGKLGLGPEAGTETHFDYQVRQPITS